MISSYGFAAAENISAGSYSPIVRVAIVVVE